MNLTGKQEVLQGARLTDCPDHKHLLAVSIKLPTDYEPYGMRSRDDDGSDCSAGCKWFLPLQQFPYDWGVCTNPESPRCGLLTFEHQGCPFFAAGAETEDEEV